MYEMHINMAAIFRVFIERPSYKEDIAVVKCDTFGDGTTENVFMILSGYSSRILEIRSVPIPDPVPPPRE